VLVAPISELKSRVAPREGMAREILGPCDYSSFYKEPVRRAMDDGLRSRGWVLVVRGVPVC
jgi:hypothetical protein